MNPRQPAWKAGTLPLSYARPCMRAEYSVLSSSPDFSFSQHSLLSTRNSPASCFGGQARIRTLEDISQQIYSLPPLATWVPAQTYAHDWWKRKTITICYFQVLQKKSRLVHVQLPLSFEKRRKIWSCGESLVQETLDCIDEVSYCQVPRSSNWKISLF